MQVEAASVSVTNMRREMQARERRAAELEAALGSLRDKSAATDAQLATSRQRVRELEVCPPVTHVSMCSKTFEIQNELHPPWLSPCNAPAAARVLISSPGGVASRAKVRASQFTGTVGLGVCSFCQALTAGQLAWVLCLLWGAPAESFCIRSTLLWL